MEQMALKAEPREISSKGQTKRLRREGKVPGIVYGKQQEAFSVQVEKNELFQVMNTAAGSNVVINLEVGSKKSEVVMIKELKRDILKRNLFTHVDFIRVSLKDKIEVDVPLSLEGEPAGIKEGGIIQVQMREITIMSLPTEIPENILVDVSKLNVGESLAIKDIELPEGTDVVNDPDEVIMSVLAPTVVDESEEEGTEEGAGEAAEPAEEE